MRALPVLFLVAGCELFGGKAGRQGRGQPITPTVHSHLDVTLVNRCAHPVEVCYGSETCLVLSGDKPRVVHAATEGNEVFVRIKDSPKSVSADVTFDMVEIDASCAHLERRIRPR